MVNGIPSLASSAQSALQSGFATLDTAAGEIVGGTGGGWPAGASDVSDVRTAGAGVAGGDDPVLSGVRDLMLAKLQVGAGAALLHAYRANRQTLFDMLDDRGGEPT